MRAKEEREDRESVEGILGEERDEESVFWKGKGRKRA